VTIDDEFYVDAPVERVWSVLKDVPRVAGCIPNLTITEVVDERTYRARTFVKAGPVNVGYDATIYVEEMNDAEHSVRFAIKGDEVRGRGGVNSTMSSQVLPAPNGSRVTLHADAKISGVVASVGGRLIEGVAKKSIATFAQNLRGLL
jgi:carbon monoxide dehydrogenase subunit G